LFAVVCTGLALCGHVIADGPAPAFGYVAAGFGGVFAAGAVALGRERGFGALAGGVLAGQFGLHALFMSARAGPMPAGNAAAARTARLAEDLLCGAGAHPTGAAAAEVVRRAGLGGAAAMPSMPPMTADHAHMSVAAMLGLSGWMIAAHVLAACVTGGYLWFGESRLWRLIRLAGHRGSLRALLRWLLSWLLRCRDAVIPGPPVRAAAPARPGRVRARLWLVSSVVSWRGPPYTAAL
jgi:hypothetical protein